MVQIARLMDLHSRTDYDKGTLNIADLDDNPWTTLESWVQQAVAAGIQDPTAFHLTTLDRDGFPHGRVVLLRDTRQGELVFYTNYESEKGQDLLANPKAGATFFWPHADRQIRIRGTVTKVPATESDAYFGLGLWPAGWGLGHLTKVGLWHHVRTWMPNSSRPSRSSRTASCRDPRIGVVSPCGPQSLSFGKDARAGCTTG